MLKSFWGVFSFILCAVFAVSLTASAADDGSEVFVVSSSFNGDAYYMSLPDKDALSSQEILQETSNPVISSAVAYHYSNGNGLGDFDNDGDLDYIMAIGFWFGNIYISEKGDVGNDFAAPTLAANWGQDGGFYAMDFAVADFDEDGKDDFVLSLDYSPNSALYLTGDYTGDEKFGFVYKPLLDTAASNSTGADAADFNNDGHADFVIAPVAGDLFYVSLGHGDGNFTTFSFSSIDGGSVLGVAAADFTGDGITDIAAAYIDKLYVYQGAILKNEWPNVGNQGTLDGVAFTYLETDQLPLPINISGLDNLEFDGDGDQYLVAAVYGLDTADVALLLSNGDGTFEYIATYSGESGDERNAVAAQPWRPVPNVAPVAVIEPVDIAGTVGEGIVFDGSNSTDEDGDIVSYAWNFGDAVPSADVGAPSLMSLAVVGPESDATGVNPSYTYQESGTYVVTLSVTDDQDSTSSVQAQVTVLAKPEPEPEPEPELVAVKVRFSPRNLYLGGKMARHHRHLRAKIRFAEGFDARTVVLSSVKIVVDNGPEIVARAKMKRGFLYKLANNHNRPRRSISVTFDRQKVIETLACPPAGETTLTVRGNILQDDQPKAFEVSGVIRLKMKNGGQCSAD